MEFSFPENEKKILQFWEKNKIFEKSVEQRSPKRIYSFYDGPPFATGTPHYGHILASVMKDAIPRFWTMRGYRVERKWGWDCHGLPIENLVEKKLGLKSKKEIEKIGIEKFNETCREEVLRYVKEWKSFIPRIGRWVDMDHPYKTMDLDYMESIWWVFQRLWKKGLVYQGYKSMHLCPRCGTVLSNFEVSLGYRETKDIAVIVKFPLKKEKNTFFLAWTTTAWTLPGNVALAVNPQATYVKVKTEGSQGEYYIIAEDRTSVLQKDYQILKKFSGKELQGIEYEPPFDYFWTKENLQNKENGWKVYGADFVTLEEGTGIVHIAPAFGEEDLLLGQKEKLPFIQHVSPDGRFTKEITDWAGKEVKPKEDPSRTDREIIDWLYKKGRIFSTEEVKHNYPFCWRCDSPLLNYATSSWFVRVTALKQNLIRNNQRIHWVPQYIKQGRFGKWLEEAKDWAVSRSRYWGTPIPIWECEKCHHREVIGSLEELQKKAIVSTHFYYLRHGEAESNIFDYLSSWPEKKVSHLTPKGKKEVLRAARQLRKKKIDIIVASDISRTKETAELVASILKVNIIYEPRLREIDFGPYNGKNIKEYEQLYSSWEERYIKDVPQVESLTSVRRRFYQALLEIKQKYQGKNILVISHQDVLATLLNDYRPRLGEWGEIPVESWPRNQDGAVDLHRPYIDKVKIRCSRCGGEMVRVKEVFDCWFESGSMPYAQLHYPFENQKKFSRVFPAQFVAEGIDQTRGWFYTLLVLSTALFNQPAFLNVIVNGIVLAENGQKMSKRLKNYPDPNDIINKYGADALRFYLLSSPAMRAEDLNFSEKGVAEVFREFLLLTWNIYRFYKLYAGEGKPKEFNSRHILDRWIVSKLHSLIANTKKAMEEYELRRAAQGLRDFINDCSRWYLRRSRERLKQEDNQEARNTLGYVLFVFSQIAAPFIPFWAEYLYQNLKNSSDVSSVHLLDYPQENRRLIDLELEKEMEEIREIASKALARRAELGIKVRQPLKALIINTKKISVPRKKELLQLLKEEINVKEIIFDEQIKKEIQLDTTLTPQLITEGLLREINRQIQVIRKRQGLTPRDKVSLEFYTKDCDLKEVILKNKERITREVSAISLKVREEIPKEENIFRLKLNRDIWLKIIV